MSDLHPVTIARFSQNMHAHWPWAHIAPWSGGEGIVFTHEGYWGVQSYSASIVLLPRSAELHVNTRTICRRSFAATTIVERRVIQDLIDTLDNALHNWLQLQSKRGGLK